MAQPVYDWMNGGLTADHNPASNEPWDQGILQYGALWRNSVNNTVWFCTDAPNVTYGDPNVNTDLSWGYLGTLVDNAPSAKTMHVVSSPAFNSPRTPSSDVDVMVNAMVSISLTILQTSLITAQVDTGAGYITVGQYGKGLIALSSPDYNTLSFLVPAGASYKLLSSGTGTTAIVDVVETY